MTLQMSWYGIKNENEGQPWRCPDLCCSHCSGCSAFYLNWQKITNACLCIYLAVNCTGTMKETGTVFWRVIFLSDMYCVNVLNMTCDSTFVLHVAIYNINLLTGGANGVSVVRRYCLHAPTWWPFWQVVILQELVSNKVPCGGKKSALCCFLLAVRLQDSLRLHSFIFASRKVLVFMCEFALELGRWAVH